MSTDNLIIESNETESDMATSRKLKLDEKSAHVPSINNVDSSIQNVSIVNSSDVSSRKIFAPRITPENPAVLRSVSLGKAPMSSMEEENLRERLHIAQLKKCAQIVSQEARYTRDTFRRLFSDKICFSIFYMYSKNIFESSDQ
ncbi:hypothetical protein HHI36_000525 [Cryptolaemus montrouzieri]|uniref:Uncharacterized protein n=1 Tax=Cryptolaemus montrouzieri TaxID=559131 RepID=A0ABD2P5B6_9CUCU